MNAIIAQAVDWKEEIPKWTCLAVAGAVILFLLFVVVIVVFNVVVGWKSPRTRVYDKVAWLGDACLVDAGLRAYVPVGMFLGWLIENELVSETFHVDEDIVAACTEFKDRVMTGPRLYCDMLGGVLTDDDLSDEGNRFVKWYINKYYGDFSNTICGGARFSKIFHADDTWDNYERICKVIDGQYDSWKRSSSPPSGTMFLPR